MHSQMKKPAVRCRHAGIVVIDWEEASEEDGIDVPLVDQGIN